MIDFSAIEAEVAALVAAAASFKTTNTGRIRETIPITGMPAADISATGHVSAHQRIHRAYTIQMLVVIRAQSQARNTNANAFKVLVEQVCAALEGVKGSSFDVLRDITSRVGDLDAGNGQVVRVATITFTARKG